MSTSHLIDMRLEIRLCLLTAKAFALGMCLSRSRTEFLIRKREAEAWIIRAEALMATSGARRAA